MSTLSYNSRKTCDDNNIQVLRETYPAGLTFVVGDTHGEYDTLKRLMEKIRFDAKKDHVFFTGDYNKGGDPRSLLKLLSRYYAADYSVPGFHLIRGNHERELLPIFPLENLPDIIVIRRKAMNYYIAHAGMLSKVFDLIDRDIRKDNEKTVYAYRLDDSAAAYDAPFRQIIWSFEGLYSQKSKRHAWPSEEKLISSNSCIIHGHTPYCFFFRENEPGYGDRSLFWTNQHIWFSEDLQSFDIDSDVKGRNAYGETYRGLSCICLEALDEIAGCHGGRLSIESFLAGENFVFSAEYTPNRSYVFEGSIDRITNASPDMKTISSSKNKMPVFSASEAQ